MNHEGHEVHEGLMHGRFLCVLRGEGFQTDPNPQNLRVCPVSDQGHYLGHLGEGDDSGDHARERLPHEVPRGKLRMNIDDLLRIATERRASDLHLKVGNYPHLRIDGELVPLTDQPRISAEDMLNMAFSMMSARQKQKFKETTEIDMAYGVAGLGRFRVNIFQQRGNVGLVLQRHSDEDSRAG